MWFDKLTTNGINKLPFVLSLSKDLIGVSLGMPLPLICYETVDELLNLKEWRHGEMGAEAVAGIAVIWRQ